LSSHQNVPCSHQDIAEKLLIWHSTLITQSLFRFSERWQ